MRLVDQWRRLVDDLPESWAEARLLLKVDGASYDRAAALLGPANPGRSTAGIRLESARHGAGGARPQVLERLLGRLDEARIAGELELLSSTASDGAAAAAADAPAAGRSPSLTAQWDSALAALPGDWSDIYAEVTLDSTDHVPRGALLMSPLNPARFAGPTGLRFRSARCAGYGASPEMVRRCFERLDSERVTGRVEILRALSETDNVATQGTVWYIGGRAV